MSHSVASASGMGESAFRPRAYTTAKTTTEGLSIRAQPRRLEIITPQPGRVWRPYGATMNKREMNTSEATARTARVR